MKRPALKSVLNAAGTIAGQLAYASEARTWLADNRERLIALLEQNAAAEAAGMLNDFCKRFPPLAAIITRAMGGDTDAAIRQISFFDTQLGCKLTELREQFRNTQEIFQKL